MVLSTNSFYELSTKGANITSDLDEVDSNTIKAFRINERCTIDIPLLWNTQRVWSSLPIELEERRERKQPIAGNVIKNFFNS